MRQKLETGVNVLMVATALTMLGFYMVDRQGSPIGGVGFMVEDWQEHNEAGIWVGPRDAPIVLTEFVDFTCPHCKTLSPKLSDWGGRATKTHRGSRAWQR